MNSLRRSLGFVFVDNQWTTTKEVMLQRGYVEYRGGWKLPQAVALEEAKVQRKAALGAWNRDLKLWMGWIGGRRDADARTNLSQISDPLAAEPLGKILLEQQNPELQRLIASVLGNLESVAATKSLIACALSTTDVTTMEQCVRYLRQRDSELAFHAFVHHLSDKSNPIVNRAATCLGQLGQEEAIPALIKALVTEHKFKKGSQPGAMSTTFGNTSDGGPGVSGFGFGGGAKYVIIPMQNGAVLEALHELTGGVSFGFDVARWQRWYTYENIPKVKTLRRDP